MRLLYVNHYPILSYPNPVNLIMPTSYSLNAETSSVKEEQGVQRGRQGLRKRSIDPIQISDAGVA